MANWIKKPIGFKDIPGYEGLYAISRSGELFSYPKYRWKGRMLPFIVDKKGYLKHSLKNNVGRTRFECAHRLVLMAFKPIKNYSNFQCNHINGNKSDNRIDNLEWCLAKENVQHAWETGLAYVTDKQRNAPKKLRVFKDESVRQIRSDHLLGLGYTALAKKYGTNKWTIRNIIVKRRYADV